MSENQRRIITHAITRMLASREHSRSEILRKLQQKGLPLTECCEQLDKFTAQDIQSDYRFAESFIRGRYAKGQGENRIRAALREHEIDDQLISQAMAALALDWFELAKAVSVKKFGERPESDWLARQKRYRFLQYRGFTSEQIRCTD